MPATANLSPDDLQTAPRRVRKERTVRTVLALAASVSVLISVLLVFSLLREAWVFIIGIDWASTWTDGWFPRRGQYDVRTLVVATMITTGIAMAVAGPIGLSAAIYLSEYASTKLRAVVKPVLEILAGIPSVVLGFFALFFIAPELVGRLNEDATAGSLAAAGIGVGLLTIPLVASVSEDAMKAVPIDLREAAAGLGARKAAIAAKVVLPAAISGVVASFIVATARAIGETMVVFIAGGAADSAGYTHSPFEGSLTMTAAMASLASGTDQVKGEGYTFQSLFFVGLLLFIITFVLNIAADRFVRRVREQY
jgi:phosphate transport system permease protein